MKTFKFLFALALGASFVACTPKDVEPAVEGQEAKEGVAEAVKTLKDYSPTKAEIARPIPVSISRRKKSIRKKSTAPPMVDSFSATK